MKKATILTIMIMIMLITKKNLTKQIKNKKKKGVSNYLNK